MSNGPDITAQEFIYRTARAAVATDIAVETRPRTNGEIPYVFVGEAEIRFHPVGREIIVPVHIWSKKEGPVQCKQLQHAIRDALDGTTHEDVTESVGVTAWRYTLFHEQYTQTRLEAGNAVWHGEQRFRILAEMDVP